ncbi:MAG: TlpA disulfide reductase family protein [Flavobacteriaceae bacterium]|nr:TlpA disulfide reductase family protein [Flavobacteriaceae bacterium]
MKEFLKKHWENLFFGVFIVVFFFVPGVREFIQRPFLMSPSLEKTENYGKLAPKDYDIALKGINVPDAHLSDFKGKNIFLNFWGSWCPPCRTEFPSIQELYDAQKDKMDFVLIAMQDDEAKVKAFIEKNNYTTPVYMTENPLPMVLEFSSFPTTFIIDKEGKILKKDQGAADWNAHAVHQFIENLD